MKKGVIKFFYMYSFYPQYEQTGHQKEKQVGVIKWEFLQIIIYFVLK